MGVDREASVREFLADIECQRLDSSEVARLLSHMAPDAKYHVSAWEPPFVGHDAIRAELLQQGEVVTDVHSEILSIASAGQTVFTERLPGCISTTLATLAAALVFTTGLRAFLVFRINTSMQTTILLK